MQILGWILGSISLVLLVVQSWRLWKMTGQAEALVHDLHLLRIAKTMDEQKLQRQETEIEMLREEARQLRSERAVMRQEIESLGEEIGRLRRQGADRHE